MHSIVIPTSFPKTAAYSSVGLRLNDVLSEASDRSNAGLAVDYRHKLTHPLARRPLVVLRQRVHTELHVVELGLGGVGA